MRFFAFWGDLLDLKKIIDHDLNVISSKYLESIKFKIDKNSCGFYQFLKFKHSIIYDFPRKVSYSKNFTVPLKYTTAFEKLVFLCEKGNGDLYRYQSRKLFSGRSLPDMMYLDFGVHHLHLGLNLNKNGMITGTEDVAFVYINDEEIFFIRIAPHQEWHLKKTIEIIASERPDLLVHRLSLGIEGDDISDMEIKCLREKGINYILKIGDNSYKSENVFNSYGSIDITTFEDYLKDKIAASIRNFFNDLVRKQDVPLDFSAVELMEFDLKPSDLSRLSFCCNDQQFSELIQV